jgi:hypothetical protein
MGRQVRAVGVVSSYGGVQFQFIGRDHERDLWACAQCSKIIAVSESLTRARKQRQVFAVHLQGCYECERSLRVIPRLTTLSGLPELYIARGAFSPEECTEALLKGPTKYHSISVSDPGDNREQAYCSVGSGLSGLPLLANRVLASLDQVSPGWVIRSGLLYVLRRGSFQQYVHLDSMVDVRGGVADDSATVFICLSAEGRPIGVQTAGGLIEVAMGHGDVAVMGPDVYHCGMPHSGLCETLFFYVDRHTLGSAAVSKTFVAAFWDELPQAQQDNYVLQVNYCKGLAILGKRYKAGHAVIEAKKRPSGRSLRSSAP